MASAQAKLYTEEDYYNMPKNIRKLNLYADAGVREYWIVNPIKQTILVYFFEQNAFDVQQYTFQDKVKVHIYEDFWIDFNEITLQPPIQP